ncbi:MAG TPA: hypothetical protein V6C52_03840 [Coleofasciculaceae cyanobacterium]|jgi:hypothetical protein
MTPDRLFARISGTISNSSRTLCRQTARQRVAVGVLGIILLGMVAPVRAQDAAIALHAEKNPPDLVTQDLDGMRLPRARNWHSLNQLYTFDRTPLGKRIPVVLVPGRAEEFQQNSWWKGFHKATERDSEFQRHYKLYTFLYNSKEELSVQAHGLANELRRRFGRLPKDQPLMLVTYSLGGVIARDVMKESDILDRVDTQIAIAVPFHGSPMFDPEWFSEYLSPPNRSPIRRFWDRSIYRGYMFGKSNLTEGLKWDNFDSSKPQFHPSTVEVAGDQVTTVIAPYKEYPKADEIRSKTIIYASYLENGYTNSNQPLNPMRLPRYVLDNSVKLPKELVATVLPVYGATVHSVFTYMNNQLANTPTYTPEDPQGRNTHLYRFNDGAIPLSSMLFLKPSTKPYDDNLTGLVKASTVRKVRVFVNIDHTHIGEYSIRQSILVKPDLIHPEEGKRSPFQWMIHDLNQRYQEITAQAEPKKAN